MDDKTAAYRVQADIAVIKEQMLQTQRLLCRQDNEVKEDIKEIKEQLKKQGEMIRENTRATHDLAVEVARLKTERKTLKNIIWALVTIILSLIASAVAWWRGG